MFLLEHGPQVPEETYEPLAEMLNLTAEERSQSVSLKNSKLGWNTAIQFARLRLVKEGLLNQLPRNLWALSKTGEAAASDQKTFVTPLDFVLDDAEPFIDAAEGRAILRVHLIRERSPTLIRTFKANLVRPTCEACKFDFLATYGALGAGYIEAHHKLPVVDLKPGARTNLHDLVPLCSNCHRMIHRNGLKTVEELKQILHRT